MSNTVHPFEKAGLGVAPFRCVGFAVMKFQACQGAPIQPGTSCDYCGTGIMNVYTVQSSDNRKFKVGCDCIAKVAWADKSLLDAVKGIKRAAREEKAAANREVIRLARAERVASIAAAFIEREGLATPLETDHAIVRDIASKIRTYGTVSPGAVALVRKIAWETAAKSVEPAEVNVPAPTGRVLCRGVVVSTKLQETQFGDTLKMTVKCGTPDARWLVWVTAPSGVCDQTEIPGYLKGCEVEFTASLERSSRDEHFAFGKRPTKARRISRIFGE